MKKYLLALAIALIVTITGCSEQKEVTTVENGMNDHDLTLVGDSTITRDDFRAYLAQRPMSSRKEISRKDIDKRLDEMVLEEVLYQEALNQGLDQDPVMQRRIRRMLTQKLLEKEVNRKVWIREITDNEYREYYSNHEDKYNRPAQVRLADIFIAVAAEANADEKEAARLKAETALTEALESQKKRTSFGLLIRKYSDTHQLYLKGDTGFFDAMGEPVGIESNMVKAAFNLQKNGSIHEQVVETTEGYHVIMRIEKKAAHHQPLASVRDHIKQEIQRQEMGKTRSTYFEGLRSKSTIQINELAMTNMTKELAESLNEGSSGKTWNPSFGVAGTGSSGTTNSKRN